MTADRAAHRYPASAFPAITGVRLAPLEAAATLVNISETGILVDCASRSNLDATLTVHFAGTFTPASVQARVVRCGVAGIAADGSLRYHLGLAFRECIALPDAVEDDDAQAAAVSPVVAAADASAGPPVLRNRW
jgi:hypothetical protein